MLALAGGLGLTTAVGACSGRTAADPARALPTPMICREAWGARPARPGGTPQTITRMTLHHAAVVLGDNRNNSQDSHLIGMVDMAEVVGRVDLRYWPLRSAQVIQSEFGTPVAATGTAPASRPAGTAPRSMRLQSEVSPSQ